MAVLAVALAACGGTEGPSADVTVSPETTVPPSSSEGTLVPSFTTVLPADASTTTTLAGTTSTSSPPETSTTITDDDLALAVLASLTVADEVRDGYVRELFRHWLDADGDGCDTRAEVLISESLGLVQRDYPCQIIEGDWYSTYDGRTWTLPGDLDVDHVVALSEAWASGAWQWSAAARDAFANDLTDERTLIAVTDSVNQSKGDGDPAEWLPSRAADVCRYVSDWLSIKARWSLRVDDAEYSTLEALLRGPCDGLVVVPWAPPPVSTEAVTTVVPGTVPGNGGSDSSSDDDVYYANCAAARAAGAAPLFVGDPGYRSGLDRDGDGVACE